MLPVCCPNSSNKVDKELNRKGFISSLMSVNCSKLTQLCSIDNNDDDDDDNITTTTTCKLNFYYTTKS